MFPAHAAERAIALDLAGLPIDSPQLGRIYGGLYDFGQKANQIANGGERDMTPGEAVEHLKPVFEALSESSSN